MANFLSSWNKITAGTVGGPLGGGTAGGRFGGAMVAGGGSKKKPTNPVDAFTLAQKKANAANEQRYQDILKGLKSTRQTVGGLFDQSAQQIGGIGDAARQRIDMGATRGRAQADQDLINRGLGNTTVRSAVMRGVGEDAERLNQELDERLSLMRGGLLERRAGAEERMGNVLAGTMNSRSDVGPDLGLFAQLMSQQAAGAAQSQPQTIFAGLSPNAQAGLDAFGRPFGSFGDRPSSQSGASALQAANLLRSLSGGTGLASTGGGPVLLGQSKGAAIYGGGSNDRSGLFYNKSGFPVL